MGIVVDTSVLIDAERRGLTVEQMLAELDSNPFLEVAISAISLMELAHGIARGRAEAARTARQTFLKDLRVAIPANDAIAVCAGLLDGSPRRSGITIGMADAVIAATALESGYKVATLNVKHFNLIPGLDVVEM